MPRRTPDTGAPDIRASGHLRICASGHSHHPEHRRPISPGCERPRRGAEVKPRGHRWWLADLDPTGFAARVESAAAETSDYSDVALTGSQGLYRALVAGHDGSSKIVLGYVGHYVDNDGTDHYVLPRTGQPYEWVVFIDTQYRKYYGSIDSSDNIEIYGKAHGLVLELEDGSIYTVPFNIICGGLCVAALVALALGSGVAAIKFWSDAKKAEAKAVAAQAIAEAERKRWEAIENLCRQDPRLCYQWGGAVVSSSAATAVAKAIQDSDDSGIPDIVRSVAKAFLPAFAPIIAVVMTVFKLRVMIDLLRDMFRRER